MWEKGMDWTWSLPSFSGALPRWFLLIGKIMAMGKIWVQGPDRWCRQSSENYIQNKEVQWYYRSPTCAKLVWWHFVEPSTFVPLDGLAVTRGMLDISICRVWGLWIFGAETRPHWRSRGGVYLRKKITWGIWRAINAIKNRPSILL
jgi:hypothetical protein